MDNKEFLLEIIQDEIGRLIMHRDPLYSSFSKIEYSKEYNILLPTNVKQLNDLYEYGYELRRHLLYFLIYLLQPTTDWEDWRWRLIDDISYWRYTPEDMHVVVEKIEKCKSEFLSNIFVFDILQKMYKQQQLTDLNIFFEVHDYYKGAVRLLILFSEFMGELDEAQIVRYEECMKLLNKYDYKNWD